MYALLIMATLSLPPTDTPSWFQTLPVRDGVVYGAGTGGDPLAAEADARRQIALRLSSTIRSEVTGDHKESSTPYMQSGTNQRASSYRVMTSVNGLPSVAVVQRAQSGSSFYALAELNVTQASLALLDTLRALEAASKGFKSRIKSANTEERLNMVGAYHRRVTELQTTCRLLTIIAPYATDPGMVRTRVGHAQEGLLDLMATPPLRRIQINSTHPNSIGCSTLKTAVMGGGIQVGPDADVLIFWDESTKVHAFYGAQVPQTTITMRLQVKGGVTLHSSAAILPAMTAPQRVREFISQNLLEWLGISPNPTGIEPEL